MTFGCPAWCLTAFLLARTKLLLLLHSAALDFFGSSTYRWNANATRSLALRQAAAHSKDALVMWEQVHMICKVAGLPT